MFELIRWVNSKANKAVVGRAWRTSSVLPISEIEVQKSRKAPGG